MMEEKKDPSSYVKTSYMNIKNFKKLIYTGDFVIFSFL